ncbi:MAG TPA: hypothetical protein VKM72_03235 [Thermoanaerobaculia bacterium]|nr:hypothetical protein [Thermoanaerobaculia bacterium]
MYDEEAVTAQMGGRLEPGIPTSAQLWGERSEYVYEGKAGEVVTVNVTTETPGLDPNVRLVDPAGLEVAFDDDSGGQGHALIQDHLLASDGTYTIRIQTDEDQHGDVTVLLSRKGDVEGTMEMAEPMGTDLLTTAEPSGADEPTP